MKISAHVVNGNGGHTVSLRTNDLSHTIDIPAKESGFGSKANGGELLFLALATCYCNDIYREAAARQIEVTGVEVEVEGTFGDPGEPAKAITYRANVTARAEAPEIEALMKHTDTVSEVQNTLRQGIPVTLVETKAQPVDAGT